MSKDKIERMREELQQQRLEKQKTREATELALKVEKEKEEHEKIVKEKSELKEKSIVAGVGESMEEGQQKSEYSQETPVVIMVSKMPSFIIPFEETGFFKRHYSQVSIDVRF